MVTIEWTSIILGMLTMLSSFGWLFDRRRHKHEMESLKADNRQKEMNLGKDYVTEWHTYIAEPLQREVGELRREVNKLRHAIQRIERCDYRANCPVLDGLRDDEESGDKASGDRIQASGDER